MFDKRKENLLGKDLMQELHAPSLWVSTLKKAPPSNKRLPFNKCHTSKRVL